MRDQFKKSESQKSPSKHDDGRNESDLFYKRSTKEANAVISSNE